MNYKDDDIIQKSAGIDQSTLEHLAHLFGTCLYKVNLDTKDICLTLNTTRITGHGFDDLPNNNHTKDSMIHEDDRELVNASIYSVISGKKDHYHIEYRMYRKDSSIVWIEEAGVISGYSSDGRPLYLSAMAADLSRLKWAQEKARDMESEVKRLSVGIDADSLAEENRLLRAANAAAATIIGGFHQSYETVLHQAIAMLGESLQSNYAAIWRNTERNDGLCCFVRSHWTIRSHTIGASDDKVYFKYDEFLPRWRENLVEGGYAVLDGSGLAKEFMNAAGMSDARSVLFTPVYLHGSFWGMMVFTRDNSVPFTALEAQTMTTVAIIVASSVSRNETLGKINMDRNKAIAETLAKGEFLSRMSHELRTPLNAIIGMTNTALREKDPQRILSHIKKVETSSQLLLNIINDVLEMSKIEAGKLEVVLEPFNFNAMLMHAEDIVRVKMDEKKQNFIVNFDESMNNLVASDEHRLLQVIVNLLSNAMKFTPQGGCITLNASQRRIGENRVKLRVEVQDSGIGLTMEQKEKLFKPFEQADGSITRRYGGTGLGLAICKKILEALGGGIWVKSKPDEGACFFFELEADLGKPVNEPDDDSLQKVINGTDTVYDWSGRTILLADDVEINREIVEMMLADTGVNIACAQNGEEAVERFTAQPKLYDLILMDVQMPVLDGLSATKLIRKIDSPSAVRVPIIAMTANAFKEDIDICIAAGMNGHIAKPINMETFFGILEKYLKQGCEN
ncbi:MAG: response regulator [Chitinispirillales bacterium]|jgi:PAS domain S-box-containing protein|nr:response regulator [Chitinispirillales bacterium]